MVSLSVSAEYYLYISAHNGQREKRDRAREAETERERKRWGLPECLKTPSGKYLAPKLISLFDQRHTQAEKEKRERFELK